MQNNNTNDIHKIIADEGEVISLNHANRLIGIDDSIMRRNSISVTGYKRLIYNRIKKGFKCDICQKHKNSTEALYVYGKQVCCGKHECESKLLRKFKLQTINEKK